MRQNQSDSLFFLFIEIGEYKSDSTETNLLSVVSNIVSKLLEFFRLIEFQTKEPNQIEFSHEIDQFCHSNGRLLGSTGRASSSWLLFALGQSF